MMTCETSKESKAWHDACTVGMDKTSHEKAKTKNVLQRNVLKTFTLSYSGCGALLQSH